MDPQAFLPPMPLAIWAVVFSLLRFENQRWHRSIEGGRQGSSPIIPALVATTGLLGLLLQIGVVIAVFVWGGGWQPALGLIIVQVVGQLVLALPIGWVAGGDNFAVWLLATMAMYPVGFFLVIEALTLRG